MNMRSNALIGSLEPANTKRKSNSAARIVVGVPSEHDAVVVSRADPDSQ